MNNGNMFVIGYNMDDNKWEWLTEVESELFTNGTVIKDGKSAFPCDVDEEGDDEDFWDLEDKTCMALMKAVAWLNKYYTYPEPAEED